MRIRRHGADDNHPAAMAEGFTAIWTTTDTVIGKGRPSLGTVTRTKPAPEMVMATSQ